MLTPELERQLTGALAENFREIELERKVVIPSQVRSFLTDVVRESLVLRADDWQKYVGLNARSSDDYPKVIDTARGVASKCIRGAVELPQYDGQYLSLISVIEWIKNNWCGIYPFCR